MISGEITAGVLTSFLLYALTIGAALGGLASVFGSMMSAVRGGSSRNGTCIPIRIHRA